jgi:serine/threonine protein kinase
MGALREGELVAGKYRLERQIGSGGMGVVFAAMHVHLEQRVALKFLHAEASENPEIVERFWREARAAVKIQSEHVARVMDIGHLEGGQPFIVMEFLEGDDLENIVKATGPLAVADAIRYLLHACEALAEVHAQGIVHRDIKPANLFLATRADGTCIVKLLDFGISKAAPSWTAAEGARSLTNTSAVIGSPRYMSPEQLRSSRDVDARSDVWALGVTLFELLGGKSPFARGTMPEVCASILKDEPFSLRDIRPELPTDLETVIRRCLAKEPDGRYRNVAELAMALRPFGPLGIIDISIERVVGVIQMSMMSGTSTITLPPVAAGQRDNTTASSRKALAPTETKAKIDLAPARSDEELERRYLSRIGPRKQVPRIAMEPSQITSISLDHRAGFLLSCIDGASTIDDVLDVSGMPRIETLRIVCELLDHGVLTLTPQRRG